MNADFQCDVDEYLAHRIKWARDRGRAWATKALVCELREDAVRILARLSTLTRRRKLNRVRATSSVVVWVRLPAFIRVAADVRSGDSRGGPKEKRESASMPSLNVALTELPKKAQHRCASTRCRPNAASSR
jgi:hypothetical protein